MQDSGAAGGKGLCTVNANGNDAEVIKLESRNAGCGPRQGHPILTQLHA